MVIHKVAVFGEIKVAFDDINTDGTDGLTEGKHCVFGVVDAAATVSRNHGQFTLTNHKRIVFDVLLRRNNIDDDKENKNNSKNNTYDL